MRIHKVGCPICGEHNQDDAVIDQMAHVTLDHPRLQRLRLFAHTRKRLGDLLIARKYDRAVRRVVWGER